LEDKKQIEERCKPKDPKDENSVKHAKEEEQRELSFVEWYMESVQNPRKKTIVLNGCTTMRKTLHDLSQSIAHLSQSKSILIEMPRVSSEISTQDADGDLIRLADSLLPIELRLEVFSKLNDKRGKHSSSMNSSNDNSSSSSTPQLPQQTQSATVK
jgi:hypothetical protein